MKANKIFWISALLLIPATSIASPSAMLGKAIEEAGKPGVEYKKSALSKSASISINPPIPLAPDEADKKATPEVSAIVQEVKDSEPTREEIMEIKKIWDGVNSAKSRPISEQPRPVISTINVDLSPGSTPPVVRVSNLTGSILSFMDASGKEWPISSVVNMSAGTVDAQEKPIEGGTGNSMFAKIKQSGASGNIAIFLKEFSTPIIVTMLSAQKDVDYRVDFRIPSLLRAAKSANGEATEPALISKTEWDDRLSNALMNLTPDGCKSQVTSNRDVSVWLCEKNQSIIRSKGVLLSPAPLNGKKIVASDMTKAYLIPSSPVLSMLINSSATSIRVTSKE